MKHSATMEQLESVRSAIFMRDNILSCLLRWERRGPDGVRRGRREESGAEGGGKWKHDMFEQLEKEEQEQIDDESQAEAR